MKWFEAFSSATIDDFIYLHFPSNNFNHFFLLLFAVKEQMQLIDAQIKSK